MLKSEEEEHLRYFFSAVLFAREKLGFEPDEHQVRVLDHGIRRGLLNCTRQWGKSTITALKAVHWAYTRAGSNVLMASASGQQAGEFLEKACDFLADLDIRIKGDGHNRHSVRLPNGSRIIAVSGRARVRGLSRIELMLIDEAAEVTDHGYRTLRPMMATVKGGSIWLMSTPEGKRGFFYETWMNGGPGWTRIQVPATECSRISVEFLEEERLAHGERWFRQEYMCEFVDLVDGLFREEDVTACISGEIPALWD
ncbi:MAG: hypothetical protein H7Y20_14760 [Bryobacteraceae bacterium]|nr:hypothetical protein [Bryobacteraceae bacterium]